MMGGRGGGGKDSSDCIKEDESQRKEMRSAKFKGERGGGSRTATAASSKNVLR